MNCAVKIIQNILDSITHKLMKSSRKVTASGPCLHFSLKDDTYGPHESYDV